MRTGLFGSKVTLVPLAGAEPQGEQPGLVDSSVDLVRVPVTKDQVKDAPRIDPDGELSPAEEERLYRHYGLDYSFGPRQPACRPIGAHRAQAPLSRRGPTTR